MSEHEKIRKLHERLRELENRIVAAWERPILEVARQAVEAEIGALGRRVARWDQMFRRPTRR